MTASRDPTSGRRSKDLLARPLSALLWWGLPFLAGLSTNGLPLRARATVLIWSAAFAWMGVGCTLNARRCHRLHCYISAPVLFLGAFAAVAAAFGFTPLGPSTASYVINATLALALMSFLAEPIWGRYRTK